MKKMFKVLIILAVLGANIPTTAYGVENNAEEESVPESKIDFEFIEQETEIIDETEDIDTLDDPGHNSIQTDGESDESSLKTEDITKTDTTSEETIEEVQTLSISPELGIEIPDYDGKLVDKENTITDTENSKVSYDYSFMPQITDKTEVVVEGTHTFEDGEYLFNLKLNKNETISVTYKNVGTYNGNTIDLKISFSNWTFMELFNSPNSMPLIKLNQKSTGIYMFGLSQLEANYFFLNSLTGLETKVSGFFNFTDIDNNQYLDIYNNANIKDIYATADNVLYYKNNGKYLTIGDYYGNDAADELNDRRYWFTYTYDKVSNFTIVFHELRESIGAYGALFEYTYQAPVYIETTKNKNKNKKQEEFDNLVAKPNQEYTNAVVNTNTISPISVETEVSNVLPRTGEVISPIPTIIGSLILLSGGLYVLSFRKKKHN